jgi:hypothetical protein
MFKEHKKIKLVGDDEVLSMPIFRDVEPPTELELSDKQPIIEKLVQKRYRDSDNCYLHITEMDYFEQFEVYKDNAILFKLRMKLWYMYMYFHLTIDGRTSSRRRR